ncbi:F0F1 ATP synthase subunit B [Sphingomonas suaedae]|uniref:ATP synthase subunit b n=2 Tax=Sphingomonas suaedae TaxID=2599297 RepID=A0A518RL96_9SPHN|nr:F0F1 ATP synthase subunit B [Sphingomonas suaedae]
MAEQAQVAGDTATDPVAANLSAASKGEGMGMPQAEVEAPGAVHAAPAVFGIDATMWVGLAMLGLILIVVWKKVPSAIGAMLDKQIAAIRTRLDEASTLRAEAEALRDEYARKIATVEQEAAAMVAHADEEAQALLVKAKADAEDLIRRRTRMAEDKIAAAERAALDEVRAKAAEAAATAAGTIIAQKHDAGADKALVDRTIAGLSRLN